MIEKIFPVENKLKSDIFSWVLYNLAVCFAVYWLSNLVLWYPWSINETLGQILMLTINPILWGFASYNCIIRFPETKFFNGVLLNSLIFILEAILSDLVFFGIIRNAFDKLMQPTTLYGWGFVLSVPFIIYFLFRKALNKNKKQLTSVDFQKPLIIGLISFAIIGFILIFDIKFN